LTSLAEHLDVILAILGVCFSLLGGVLLYAYKQLVSKIELVGTERRGTAQEARDTKEQLIRLSERLEGYIRVQDRLVQDFQTKWERSDTLHMQILMRLGKLLNNGKPGSPLDSLTGEHDGT
jgi:hypothetical protein